MTDRLELLSELIESRITIATVDGNVTPTPADKVTPEVVARVRNHKSGLLEILLGQSDICERCAGRVVRDKTFDGRSERMNELQTMKACCEAGGSSALRIRSHRFVLPGGEKFSTPTAFPIPAYVSCCCVHL